jgi:hypothetical protein
MIMPWGKFKYEQIEDLPDSYLLWLNFTADIQDPRLAGAVMDEIENRFPDRLPVQKVYLTQENENVSFRDRLKTIYRQMAMKFHPDRGGSLPAMQAINLFYEKLCG